MRCLLNLCISCITEENYWAEYSIGFFQSIEDVEEVVKRLRSAGGKFSDPGSEVRISEVEIVGEDFNVECVYRFYGQNIDSSSDDELIESLCYVDKSTAIQELMKAKKHTPRQQWKLETYTIGKAVW